MKPHTVWHLATTNPGKVRDWTALLDHRGWTVAPLVDLVQVDEVGQTAEDNAVLKALGASSDDRLVLADDVGLWVDAMNGQPGLMLKRWAMGLGGWEAARDHLGQMAGTAASFEIGLAAARNGTILARATVRTEGILVVSSYDGPGVEPNLRPLEAPAELPALSWHDRERFHYRHIGFRALLARLT
jgi:inosine/xanthosine triphosphate pyrophosphatase family protein